MPEGIVTKGVNGFFTVKSDGDTRVCKARGVFRKRGIQVWVGDRVTFDPVGNQEGVITAVLPRTTELIRPPVANVEQALLVCSFVHPDFQPGLLDRMLVAVLAAKLEPLIVMNKADLIAPELAEKIAEPYRAAGHPVVFTSASTANGVSAVKTALSGKVTVFVGPSGVGKSSLANALSPDLGLKMGEISEKLGRGKHTTRHVELFEMEPGMFVVDAPGFSQIEVTVMPEDVRHYFREFDAPAQDCSYRTCQHTEEEQDECGVRRAVENGMVSRQRYESYLSILGECREREERRY